MKKRYGALLLFCLCLLFLLPAGGQAGAAESPTYRNTLVKKDGAIYYYNAKGKMVRSRWMTIQNKRYYFTKTGAAAAGGLVTVGNARYIFNRKGVMQRNGFRTLNGKTYYVNSSGTVLTGWQTIKGKRYRFTGTGVMRKGWFTRNGKTFYLSKTTGAACTGWQTIDKKRYYFDSKGILAKSQWIGNYYVNKNGVLNPKKKRALANLETKLKSAVQGYRGTWSVYVEKLDTGESISVNNQKMYAASLIKLFALGAAYDRIRQGKLSESYVTPTLRSMITVSDNYAFNEVVRWVGITYVNTWCKENGYTQTNQGRGLNPSGNSAGLDNGSGTNLTSASDCGRFLASIYRGTCVSKSASQKMLAFLKQQERRWKIPAGVPGGVVVANKTGETDDYTHDAAIVYSKGGDYVLVVMGYVPGQGWGSAGNITSLSRMVYDYFNK